MTVTGSTSEKQVEAAAAAIRRWLWWYVLVIVLFGCVAGLVWEKVVRLPRFALTSDLRAVPSPERDLAAWFAIDAWFSILGLVVGLILGVWSWLWFRRTGWFVTLAATLGALAAAALCWRVGTWLGPEAFDIRLARALPGDEIEIAFELRSWPAVLLWPFAAITPVMLLSAFTSDAGDDAGADEPRMSE
ncbi:MAG: hypothetical protein Q4B08_13105 [Propionibacteriaceae bacterium]|nr:hypothetical protein [Propionibacteriaceae bacterium]